MTQLLEILRRLWPFVLRRTHERAVARLQQAREEDRRRIEALVWWRGEKP